MPAVPEASPTPGVAPSSPELWAHPEPTAPRLRGKGGRFTSGSNGNGKAPRPPKILTPEERQALSDRMRSIRPAQPAKRHGIALPVDEATLAQYEQRLIEQAPHLQVSRYAVARRLLAMILVRLDRLSLWYGTPGAWFLQSTARGKASIVQPVEQRFSSLVEEARRLLESCALTPTSARSLGLDVVSPDQKDIGALRDRFTKKGKR